MTLAEAAELRGSTEGTIRVHVSRGRLRGHRQADGSWKVERAQVLGLRGYRKRARFAGKAKANGSKHPRVSRVKAMRDALTKAERRVLSYALYSAALSGKIDAEQKPHVHGLMLLFADLDLDDNPQSRHHLKRLAAGIPDVDDVPVPPVTIPAPLEGLMRGAE